MELTAGRVIAIGASVRRRRSSAQERPTTQEERGGPSLTWNMESMVITKLEGACRAWESYANVGQLPRSGAVVDP